MIKKSLILLICLFFSSQFFCADISETENIEDNKTYVALVIDNIDKIRSMTFSAKGKNIRLTGIPEGRTLFLLEVESKEYCLTRFRVYDLRVKFKDYGMCFFVEEGELNYPGHIVIRNPITIFKKNHSDLAMRLSEINYQVCTDYLNVDCEKLR